MLDLRCCDNINLMAQYPDNYFDLAIVDPPYGIGFSDYERGGGSEKIKNRYTKSGKKNWDNEIPSENYFKELFRVSKNQIIWGGNYFNLNPTQCFIFWYKQNPVPNFSDGEYAWTSFKKPAICFNFKYYGNLKGNTCKDINDFNHPTQKPIELYNFCFHNFAKQNDKILDTHLGSGSIAIATHYSNLNLSLTACEIDEEIFNKSMMRIKEQTKQLTIF